MKHDPDFERIVNEARKEIQEIQDPWEPQDLPVTMAFKVQREVLEIRGLRVYRACQALQEIPESKDQWAAQVCVGPAS